DFLASSSNLNRKGLCAGCKIQMGISSKCWPMTRRRKVFFRKRGTKGGTARQQFAVSDGRQNTQTLQPSNRVRFPVALPEKQGTGYPPQRASGRPQQEKIELPEKQPLAISIQQSAFSPQSGWTKGLRHPGHGWTNALQQSAISRVAAVRAQFINSH